MWSELTDGLIYNPFDCVAVRSEHEIQHYLPEQLRRNGSLVPEVKGGILADEMGLGKTVEVLALIVKNRKARCPSQEVCHAPVESQPPVTAPVAPDVSSAWADFVEDEGADVVTEVPSISDYALPPPSSSDDASRVCICGNAFKRPVWVRCRSCGGDYHAACVGFRNASEAEAAGYLCDPQRCFTCVAHRCFVSPIPSRATLIVTPSTLTRQWENEILKHTTNLKVCVYGGVKMHSRANATHLLNPHALSKHDVILTTFSALKDDLAHSDANPYSSASGADSSRTGKRKRYRIFPSPLTGIEFWRVILDEAQKVATPTAMSAEMALRLHSKHRWAVSGTPVAKNSLDDVYGLLLFLDQAPWSNKQIFKNFFDGRHPQYELSCRVKKVFGEIMWRCTKRHPVISKQLGVPPLKEKVHAISFSPIERAVYDSHFTSIRPQVASLLRALQCNNRIRKSEIEAVSTHIARLRATCSHPTVGTHGIVRRKKATREKESAHEGNTASTLTMLEIAERLKEDAATRASTDLQTVVYHKNAIASLLRLQYDFHKTPAVYEGQPTLQLNATEVGAFLLRSVQAYVEALALQSSDVDKFKFDKLQRMLRVMYFKVL